MISWPSHYVVTWLLDSPQSTLGLEAVDTTQDILCASLVGIYALSSLPVILMSTPMLPIDHLLSPRLLWVPFCSYDSHTSKQKIPDF